MVIYFLRLQNNRKDVDNFIVLYIRSRNVPIANKGDKMNNINESFFF